MDFGGHHGGGKTWMAAPTVPRRECWTPRSLAHRDTLQLAATKAQGCPTVPRRECWPPRKPSSSRHSSSSSRDQGATSGRWWGGAAGACPVVVCGGQEHGQVREGDRETRTHAPQHELEPCWSKIVVTVVGRKRIKDEAKAWQKGGGSSNGRRTRGQSIGIDAQESMQNVVGILHLHLWPRVNATVWL